jgi:hypothetical protein
MNDMHTPSTTLGFRSLCLLAVHTLTLNHSTHPCGHNSIFDPLYLITQASYAYTSFTLHTSCGVFLSPDCASLHVK